MKMPGCGRVQLWIEGWIRADLPDPLELIRYVLITVMQM